MDDFAPINSNSLVFAGPYWGSLEYEILYWAPHIRWLREHLKGPHFTAASYPSHFPLYLGITDEFIGLPDAFVNKGFETQYFEALCDQKEYSLLIHEYRAKTFKDRFKKIEYVRPPRGNYHILRRKKQLVYSKLLCSKQAMEEFDAGNAVGGGKPVVVFAMNMKRKTMHFATQLMTAKRNSDTQFELQWPDERWAEVFNAISLKFGDRISLVDITGCDPDLQIAALKRSVCSILPDNEIAAMSIYAGCPTFIYGGKTDRFEDKWMNPFDTDIVFYESIGGLFNEPSGMVIQDAEAYIGECLAKNMAVSVQKPMVKNAGPIKTVGVIGDMDNPESTNVPLSKAFETLGYHGEAFPFRTAVREIGISEANKHIVEVAHTFDLMIFCKNNGSDPGVIRECSRRGAKTIWYMMDAVEHIERNPIYFDTAEAADICVVTTATVKEALVKHGIKSRILHLIQGVDTDRYFPIITGKPKEIDFLFIGLRTIKRDRILGRIASFGFKVEAHGPGYNEYVNADNFNRLCSMAKVCIAINNTDPNVDSFSDRILRYMSCGCRVLSELSKELFNYFEHGSIVAFREDELDKNFLDSVLNSPPENDVDWLSSEEIRSFIVNKYSWVHVAQTMLDLTNAEGPIRQQVEHSAAIKDQISNIGFVSQWYQRGQTYITKMLMDAISGSQHQPRLLARNAVNDPNNLIVESGDDLQISSGIIEICPTYAIPPVKFADWLERIRPKILFFNEEPQWELVGIAKQRGIKAVGYFVWELFDPEDAAKANALYDAIICPTECSYNTFKDEYGIKKAVHLPWGIDPAFYITNDNLIKDQKGIVFFHPAGWGGLHERRGTQYVIDAFVNAKLPNAILHIHTQKQRHEYNIDGSDKIVIDCGTVARERLVQFYLNSDVVVLPSLWEGLGLTFLEAIGCGKPIITTDAPPMNEFVKEGSGILCTGKEIKQFEGIFVPGIIPDISKIAEGMKLLCENENLQIATKQTAELRKSYEFDGFRERVCALVEHIMEA